MLTTSNIVIRRMEEADVATVADIEKQCFADPWSEKAFLSAASDCNYIYMVAEIDGNIIGMAGCICSIDEGDLTNVAVRPEYRGQGVAKQVVTELMNQGKRAGILYYTLEVREHNSCAIRLYESLGFVCEGKRPGFYSNPSEDALIYWKRD